MEPKNSFASKTFSTNKGAIHHFDDAFGLGDMNLDIYRFVVFIGESGSGKSSYISWLKNTHKDFRSLESCEISPHMPSKKKITGYSSDLIIIDELLHMRNFCEMLPIFWREKKILIASHLPVWIMGFLRVLGPTLILRIDTDSEKIARYLSRKGYTASKHILADFTKKFRANYTDIDIILETGFGNDFDLLYKRFLDTHTILK